MLLFNSECHESGLEVSYMLIAVVRGLKTPAKKCKQTTENIIMAQCELWLEIVDL